MSLMLSRHGIWYYRKVNVLPCGKRREFRRSLGTRSKTEATKRSLRFADRPWLITETATTTIDSIQSPHSDLSLSELKLHAEQYIEFKSREVCEREVSSIKRCIDKYFSFTDQVFKRRRAAEFIRGLDVAIPTNNKYVKKISGFSRWLKHRTDYDFQNPFEGLLQKDREPVFREEITEMANGTPWLEPQWVGGHGDVWAVYPFTDFNVTQMMPERKAKQSKYWVMMIFGFTGDNFRRLIKTTGIYRSVYFPVGFPIGNTIDQNTNPAILSFSEDFFESVDDYWKVYFNAYCQDIQHLNEMSKDNIETMAIKVISQASVTDKPLLTASTHVSVMTYSGSEWVVSSPDGIASSKVH